MQFDNCTDPNDGKTRNGTLVFNYSGSPANAGICTPGFIVRVTSNSYTVGNVTLKLNGITLTNTTPANFNPATTNISWHIVSDIKASTLNWTILHTADRGITLLTTSNAYNNGSGTIDLLSAIFSSTGSGSGVSREGKPFTHVTTSPVLKVMGCYWINKGSLDIQLTGLPTRTIDFGNGTCDNKGTVTINGNAFEFTMN